MSKPTLYIMCGLPFSGKTILTKKIVNKLNFASVNIDNIKFANGFEWKDDDEMTTDDWEKIFDESYQKTLQFLSEGKSVIYDCANQDRAARDELRDVAKKGNYPTKVIWLDIPENIIRKRWLANKETKARFDLPERIFQSAIDSYEIPTKDENVIRFNQSTNFEDWIKSNFLIKS